MCLHRTPNLSQTFQFDLPPDLYFYTKWALFTSQAFNTFSLSSFHHRSQRLASTFSWSKRRI